MKSPIASQKATHVFRHAAAVLPLLASANAGAMYLNDKGEGQVLIYPYYTVNHGQQTLLTVSNTDAIGKALRVSFREGLNGREVVTFNVYLSAHDSWTGVVFALSDAGLGTPNAAAAIGSFDKSCTLPALPQHTSTGMAYQPFLNYAYIGTAVDGGPDTDVRTHEGFIQIIEMTDVTSAAVNAATVDCAGLANLDASQLSAPTGGLTGRASIVDVVEGTFYSFDATAIQGFLSGVKYSSPGPGHELNLTSASTSLGNSVVATALADGQLRQLGFDASNAIDAVSALLASERLDLQIENAAGIFTDWVVTFPTKQYYVDPAQTKSTTTAIAPFSKPFAAAAGSDAGAQSNVRVSMSLWDRDGAKAGTNVPLFLPYEVNVLSRSVAPFGALSATNTAVALTIPSSSGPATQIPSVAGTATLTLNPAEEPHVFRPALDGTTLKGLPVIGFEAIKYVNANATPGVLANYSGTYPLKGR